MEELSDADILKMLRSTDKEDRNKALEYLYDNTYGSVASYIIKNSGHAADAKDMFQESLIVFFEKATAPSFELTGSIKNYLHAVCRNLWLKRLRKSGRMVNVEDIEGLGGGSMVEAEEDILDKYPDAGGLLRKVGDSCRQILTLFYFNRMNMKQIADYLNLANEGVAKNKKARCMQKIKEIAKAIS